MWDNTGPAEQDSSGFADLLSDTLTFFLTLLIFFLTLLIVGGAIGVMWWLA